MAETAPYGTWRSPITAELVSGAQVGLAEPRLDRGIAYWLEARPQEGGRSVLVRRRPSGPSEDVSLPPFNVRTRVHEYGGGAYAVRQAVVVAVDFGDQRVHRLREGAPPAPLTPESGGRLRYADLELDLPGRRLFAVREDHRGTREPINSIVMIPLDGAEREGVVVAGGHDFFSSPRLAPEGRELAWLSWDHPNMPWDGTTLWRGVVRSDGKLGEVRKVAGGAGEAIVQPAWSPDGKLYFVSDRSGWWNLYRVDESEGRNVCPMSAEFAGPAWTFGMRWYGFLSADLALVTVVHGGISRLATLELGSGRLDRLEVPFSHVAGVDVAHGQAIARVGAPDRPAAIIRLDPRTAWFEELARATDLALEPGDLSAPAAIEFPSQSGGSAYGYFYPPGNRDFEAPAGELPPLIIKSHGGPTGASSTELRLGHQFWTSRGFALCDVNYGGSTGYGRAYRERLIGQWGVVDVADCVSAAQSLAADRKADGARLIITGGSAGGFTTLCALTFHDLFRAGASHYGVSDLEALARDTHKFESRYLDRLVGPWPQAAGLYRARSPLHHAQRLSCPIIFFQGLEDVIVPPAQTEAMVQALRRKGVAVAYLAFPGEQHGFRQAATIRTVLAAELAFYGRVMGFTPADGLADLAIDNLQRNAGPAPAASVPAGQAPA